MNQRVETEHAPSPMDIHPQPPVKTEHAPSPLDIHPQHPVETHCCASPLDIRALYILITLLASITYGCHRNTILSDDQMVDILFDIYRFDATALQQDSYLDNNTKAAYYNGIFRKHHTTKEQFDETLRWYASHPDKWRLVYEKLGKKSEAYVDLVQSGKLPELQQLGISRQSADTLDLWMSKPYMYWYSNLKTPVDNSRTEQLTNGRKYFVGARKVELSFRMRCQAKDTLSTEACMIIKYSRRQKSDTLRVSAPADNRWRTFTLSTGTAKKGISSVYISLADSASLARLSSLEYEKLRFSYIFSKNDEHININDQRIFERDRTHNQNRQVLCNSKRLDDD